MTEQRVVEAFYVIEHIGLCLCPRAADLFPDPLGLEQEKRLSVAALSQTLPHRLITQSTPLSFINRWNCAQVCWADSTGRHNAAFILPGEELVEGVRRASGLPHRQIAMISGSASSWAVKRIEKVLGALTDRPASKDRAIEDSMIEPDAELKERLARLKDERDIVIGTLEQITTSAAITSPKIATFTELMRERLKTGDTRARKDWLGSLIQRVEVDDGEVRIIGSKHVLAAALASRIPAERGVYGLVRKWRTRQDSNL